MAVFLIFIFHGDFVFSQIDIYSVKSHRSKEVSGFWLWSHIGNWHHMMICGSATDVPIDLCGSTFPPFTYTWKRCQNTSISKITPYLIFDCDVLSKHTHILHSDPLTHSTTKRQNIRRATISSVLTSILWYRSPSMSVAWFWLPSILCCAWYRPLHRSQRRVQL